jgi:hypothetical protein
LVLFFSGNSVTALQTARNNWFWGNALNAWLPTPFFYA